MENLEKISKYILLAIPFSVVVSVLYLEGYWGQFSVNIFEYLSSSDIVVASVVPFMGVGIASLIGVLIGSLIIKFKESHLGKESKITKYIIRLFEVVFLLTLILFVFFGGENKWIVLPVLFSIIVIFFVFFLGIIEINEENLKRNFTILIILTLVPFQAYGFGKRKALLLKHGKAYQYVVSEIDGLESSKKTNIRLLGKAGDYAIIINCEKNNISVIALKKINVFSFKSFNIYDRKNET